MSKGLLKSTSVFAGMTLISRLMGFARDMVFAYFFGAHGGFDAFVVAFKIPNFMRRLFAEGAFSQAFVPVLSEYREQKSPEELQKFLNHTAGNLTAVLLLVTLIAEIAAPLLILMFAPGFLHDPDRYALAVGMLRLTFPYLMLISLVAFSGAILNSFGVFGAPAFAPVLLNVSLISTAIWLAPHFHVSVQALSWGVLIAGFAQLLFLIPFLMWKGLLPRLSINFRDKGVRRVLKLMAPAIFGVSVAQFSILVDTLFASFLAAGSISWLYYSQQLTFFPLGVFGVAIATVVLPHLSRNHAAKSEQEYCAAMDWALRCVLVVAIPAAAGLILMSGPLIATLFFSGNFDHQDVVMSQQSLMAFSVGLPGFMLVKTLASGFYSRQDINTPVRIGVVAFLCNILLNLLLIYPLKHAGLALATALSSTLNAGLLFHRLRQDNIYLPLSGWHYYLGRLFLATVAVVFMLWLAVPTLDTWLAWGRSWRILNLLVWVFAAIAVYLSVLWGSGLRLRDFKVQDVIAKEAV